MTPASLGRLALVTLAVLVSGAAAAFGQVPDRLIGKAVTETRLVSGGRVLEDAQLEGLVEIQAGRPLSMSAVRETIVHLMGMGRYLDVRVSAIEAGDGVRVQIELVPLLESARVVFTGELGLPESTLRAAVTERFGPSPAYNRAGDIARVIETLLADRGYLRARVDPGARGAAASGDIVFAVASGPRAVVRSISYRADPQDAAADIRSRVSLKPGAFFDRGALGLQLGAAVERWRAQGYYEAAASEHHDESETGDAVDVVVTFIRGPRVSVEVKDNALTPKQRAELVPVEREASVDEDLLEDSEARIEDRLRAQGYRDARASYERIVQGDTLRIVFSVRPGPLYRVAGVRFDGASAVPAAELGSLMSLRAGEPFVQARLDADVRMVLATYRQRGYAEVFCRPAIEPVPGARTDREAPVVITMLVAEGPRTIVSGVEIVGNRAIGLADLEAGLAVRAGAPLYQPDVDGDRDRILLRYLNRGHRLARVEPSIGMTPDRTAAHVRFLIEEGPQIVVDHILVVGNDRVSVATIRKEVLLQPGKPLGLEAIDESQRRLASLGVFRRVSISELQHQAADRRDVLVSVEEAPATTLGYGGGIEFQKVETVEFAPRGFVEIGRRNLWGKNRSVNLFSRVSVRRRSGTETSAPAGTQTDGSQTMLEYRVIGTYREPRVAGRAADLQAAIGFEQGSRTSFDFRTQSARVGISQRYGPYWSLQGQYAISRNDIFNDRINPADLPLIYRLYPQVRIGSVSASAARNTRDDTFNPTRGTLVGLNGELALRAIGSEVGFAKTFLQGFVYRKLPASARIVFAGGARLGIGTGFPQQAPVKDTEGNEIIGPDGNPVTREVRDLPWSERYFAGGDTTVRGFQLDRLGEPDTFDSDGTPIGGRAEIILNGEIRVALRKELGVVGFFDSGNVYSAVTNVSLGHLRAGAGFGLRYNSPVGPLRFDFGFKLGTLRTYGPVKEGRFALHISIGQAF